MIEVRLVLHNHHERALFEQLMGALDHIRGHFTTHPQQAPETGPAPEATVNDTTTGEVIAHIQPDPAGGDPIVVEPAPEPAAPAGPKIEQAELEAVVWKYLQAKGLPATREKIAAFGYPQLDKVPAEKWAELKALFEAALAE